MDTKKREKMNRKNVIKDLRKEIEVKRSKIEDINDHLAQAYEYLKIYTDLKEKFENEIDQIEDTLALMEM